MEVTIATGVRTGGLAPKPGKTATGTEGKARAAAGRSIAWKRFFDDFSKAIIMTDPIAYGWYLAWTLEA
jgi:hypothetical protein